ncbi:hypothetical protein, partial [Raoultella ornithinolytica]|uniref:hypothetical protein n=1 Tax=Raoultella ornithinolytica TaxID=54291 RepID=UPI001C616086
VIGVVVALVQEIIEGESPDIVVSELTTPYASICALRCPRESIENQVTAPVVIFARYDVALR